MTNGWRRGTSGRAVALAAGAIAAVNTVNVLSQLHDAERAGKAISALDASAYEYSSGLAILLAFLIFAPLARLRPARLGWPKFLALHAAGTLVWSAAHVLLMVGVRHLLWSLAGERYDFDFARDWIYEYRKDVISYVLLGAIAWLAPPRGRTPADLPPAEIRLRDGSRWTRFPAEAVEAAEACGNYVELKLADGRRPLVRTTLSAAEAELRPHGFLRTHRSWLVRGECVTGLAPTGSGDHAVTLASGLSAPLSRRFPEALHALREALGETSPRSP
ncbi:LytTR family DNA-binding domain-containing protein [Phenylobacterium sp.]|uniref:LytTR family DNA-binding domain-containing protein n=1 Tax=Phenylobacterium sp. TaxID=1871053 RepID=UPI0035B1B8AE